MKISRILPLLCAACLLAVASSAGAALTAGASYTVTVEKINSNGTLTGSAGGGSSLGVSTTATADSNGKLSFTLSNVPDNTTCNFLVVTVTDSNGIPVRQGIGPCPPAGSTMPLGVSQTTAKQTTAMIDAFADAGSDDPILAVFGLTIVRSPGLTASELSTIASIANTGISGSGGFVQYLTNNGVTACHW